MKKALLLFIGVFSFIANADTTATSTGPHLEITGATSFANGGGAIINGTFQGQTLIQASGQVSYLVGGGFELFLQPSFVLSNLANATTASFGFLAGPMFNFPNMEDIRNDFFVQGGVGLGTGGGNTTFEYGFELGKRISLTDSISWAPQVSLIGVTNQAGTGTGVLQYGITPLSFSLMFM
jgi:hypothetical protein